MDRQVAHAQVDATTAVHFLEQASFGPTALEVTAVQGDGPGGLDRPAVGHAREPASRRPRRQRGAGAALPQHGHRARPAAPAGDVRAQPDHRGVGQQGHHRRGTDAVGAAAVAQRLRQLPHSCCARCRSARRWASTSTTSTTARPPRPPRPTRTTPASCCSCSRSAPGTSTPTAARSSTAAASRSPATARRRLPTTRGRSPAGRIRRGPGRPRATTTRSTSSARSCRPRAPAATTPTRRCC